VFHQLYNKSAKQVTRKINMQIKELKKSKRAIELFSDTVRSLKALKPHLEQRCDYFYPHW